VYSFGVIWFRISDPTLLALLCIKRSDESTLVMDSSVPLMYDDPSDLGTLIKLIQITLKDTLQAEPFLTVSDKRLCSQAHPYHLSVTMIVEMLRPAEFR